MNAKTLLTAVAALVVAACSDAGGGDNGGGPVGPGGPTPVARVEVSAPATAIDAGTTLQLAATPRAADGRELVGRAVAWTSDNHAVATVTGAGLVTAHAAGTVTITAVSEGREGAATLTVRPVTQAPQVVWVQITPVGDVALPLGSTRQLGVTAYGPDMTVIEGRPAEWSSGNPAVVTVSAAGLLEARAAGTAVIGVAVDGKTATVTVTVPARVGSVEVTPPTAALAVGDTVRLVARVRAEDGATIIRPVAWTSSNASVATVDAAGKVTAAGSGTVVVTATVEGKSATAWVVVSTWTARRLVSVNGAALPATVFQRTETVNGQARTTRYEAHEGLLRLLSAGGRYELLLNGWLHTSDQLSVQAGTGSIGQFVQELDGTIVFTNGGGRGRVLPDGRVEVTWIPQPGTAPVTLIFAAP